MLLLCVEKEKQIKRMAWHLRLVQDLCKNKINRVNTNYIFVNDVSLNKSQFKIYKWF